LQELKTIGQCLRQDIFKMAYRAGGAHLGACFSAVDILVTLYFSGILRYDTQAPCSPGRDRFILSKGHASAALYATLAQSGFFPRQWLWEYCQPGSTLGGHPNMLEVPGVEASTGALGHGLGFGVGHALAGKLDHADYRTFVLLGDGECQEGSVWEAVLFAAAQQLDNLTVILDANGLQAMEKLPDIIPMEPWADKFAAFGWQVTEVDGHDYGQLVKGLKQDASASAPRLIIARTVKGKGVSFMESVPIWHFRMPDEGQLAIALQELGLTREELVNYA